MYMGNYPSAESYNHHHNQDTEPLCVLVAQSCPTLWDPMHCSPPGTSVRGDPPGKNTAVGYHALLQGVSIRTKIYLAHILPGWMRYRNQTHLQVPLPSPIYNLIILKIFSTLRSTSHVILFTSNVIHNAENFRGESLLYLPFFFFFCHIAKFGKFSAVISVITFHPYPPSPTSPTLLGLQGPSSHDFFNRWFEQGFLWRGHAWLGRPCFHLYWVTPSAHQTLKTCFPHINMPHLTWPNFHSWVPRKIIFCSTPCTQCLLSLSVPYPPSQSCPSIFFLTTLQPIS